ncbi:hypothetical protein SLNSH_15925 [Alsobacter soli]|uniref:GtrA family protein n=1 Tax=Alsobacter soli TaxID=2109933 RepID=A0A2T1HR17_9HYPH|nr:hypothetical protein [Alsobacter soli]PSC04090.1 hypothetical protein SLNSH_15925 [Alsobacter soli]
MTDAALPAIASRPWRGLVRDSRWAALAAWGIAVAGRLSDLGSVGTQFNDTDDATRLLEVRDLLAGQPWFDLVQHRLDPAFPIPMHWSRLVDAPIALLVLLFERVTDGATAERWAMIAWPQIVLLAAIFAVRALARRLGGNFASTPAVFLLALGLSMTWQFVPGRIDHHSVQATLLLWCLSALLDPTVRGGALAGALSAGALAVGIETVLFQGLAAAAVAARFLTDPSSRAWTRAYGASLAGTTLMLAAATVPPTSWTHGACDALSLGYIALLAIGGAGLALAAARERSRGARAGWLVAVAAAALAAFVAADPACVRGPMASIDPRLFPVWLDHNQELASWPKTFRQEPVSGALLMMGPALGALSAAALLTWPDLRRSPAAVAILACFAVAVVMGSLQIRSLFYANMLAVPLIAAAIGRFAERSDRRGGSALAAVIAGLLLANNTTWALAAASMLPDDAVVKSDAQDSACLNLGSYARLAALPPGLVVGPIDFGPFVLAATRHSVLGAPYHRQAAGIVDGYRMLTEPPAVAIPELRARGAAYVALCSRSRDFKRYVNVAPDGLLARLDRGEAAPGLEPIETDGLIRIYRVTP